MNDTETFDRIEWERFCQQKMEDEWNIRELALKQKLNKKRDEEMDRVLMSFKQGVAKGRRASEEGYQQKFK